MRPRSSQHDAPALTFTGAATVLNYWAERTSVSSEVFASPELATLSTSIGSLDERINTALALDPELATSTSPLRPAVTEHHGIRVHGWPVALWAVGDAPDITDPFADVTSPADDTTITPGITDIEGITTDDISDVNRVRIQQLGTTNFWDGTAFTPGSVFHDATLNGNGTWTYPTIDFPTGNYRIRPSPPTTPEAPPAHHKTHKPT